MEKKEGYPPNQGFSPTGFPQTGFAGPAYPQGFVLFLSVFQFVVLWQASY